MGGFHQFAKASRMQVLPVILLPILLGTAASYIWYDAFHFIYLLVCLIGGAAIHLFSNMINDWWDYRNGVDKKASEMEGVIMTNSSFLLKEIWPAWVFSLIMWSLFATSAAAGIYLTIVIGMPILIYAAVGAFLAFFYVAPPIKLGYRGKGFSELAIFIAFGILPVTGAIFVQASTLDVRAFLLASPIGLMTTLILFNHHFLHWQSDKAAGKRTLVVVLGERGALLFSKLLLVLVVFFTIVCVSFGALPWYSLIALVTLWPLGKAYSAVSRNRTSGGYLSLMIASSKGTMRFGLVLVLAFIAQAILS